MEKQITKVTSLKIISYYTGFIIMIVSALLILPLIVSLIYQEWNTLSDFLITCSVSAISGLLMMIYGYEARQQQATFEWKHGLTIAALVWIILMFLCAIPYRLSGHNTSMLDACFDVMSGFTTTGLVLTTDIDHISMGLNVWRHLLTFVGGQGMIVLALSFLARETGGTYKMYIGEAKDIELLPNVKGTARYIWKISMIYLFVGTLALWIVGLLIGLKPASAFFHALFIFQSSWSTGGFAPNSQNMLFYHSFIYESIALIFCILGSFNFGLHYAVWKGKKKELFHNIEVKSFLITSMIACIIVTLYLEKFNIYKGAIAGFRRIVFNIISAHTTTGFGNVYARQFLYDWNEFGIAILIIAMMIGGSACSTAGGIKGLRVGILLKGFLFDIKKLISSDRAIQVKKVHHIKDIILSDALVKSSALITICYIIVFILGTLIGNALGYPIIEAAFESASVTGNVGLSIGITSTSMPSVLKLFYIVAMYLGRLEFLSVFALIAYIIGGVRRKCFRK